MAIPCAATHNTQRSYAPSARLRLPASFVVGLIAFGLLALTSHLKAAAFDNYVWMADGWLHGLAYLPHYPGDYIDAIPYHGRAVLVEAPIPGVLMLPLVLIWGTNANQTYLSITLGAVGLGAAWLLCERLRTSLAQRIALTSFLCFGTSFYWCAQTADVWYIAHVSGVAFTMLALAELAGERRGWLVALYAGAAGLSRFPFFVALPFYALLVRAKAERPLDGRRGFVLFAVAAAAAWVWDNEARFATFSDIGLTVLYNQSLAQFDHYGAPFHIGHLDRQLHAYFQTPPLVSAKAPWLAVSNFGVSLEWCSPALAVAFFASRPGRIVAGLWLLALAIAIPQFVYFSVGDLQFGMRHALDFEPYLFVLMVFAIRAKRGVFLWPLFAYSVAFGIWGLWFWQAYPPGTTP